MSMTRKRLGSGKTPDWAVTSVFSVNNDRGDNWANIMTEMIRRTRCCPDFRCLLEHRKASLTVGEAALRNTILHVPSDEPMDDDDGDGDPLNGILESIASEGVPDMSSSAKCDGSGLGQANSSPSSHNPEALSPFPAQFAGFSRLPSELRTRIWLETVPAWTLVIFPYLNRTSTVPSQSRIDWSAYHGPRINREFTCDYYKIRWCGDLKLYQICRASRQVASAWYGPPSPRSVPFSPVQDEVCISSWFGWEHTGNLRLNEDCDPRVGADSSSSSEYGLARQMALPNDLLSKALRVRLDFGILECTWASRWQTPEWWTNVNHDMERIWGLAQYVRDTFPGVRHLTFSFAPFDDCAMRPTVQWLYNSAPVIANLFGGYDPSSHYIYYAPRVAFLDAFARLSSRDEMAEGIPRVAFPKLRTLELEWTSCVRGEWRCQHYYCCGEAWENQYQPTAVEETGSRLPGWIRVEQHTAPDFHSVLSILENLCSAVGSSEPEEAQAHEEEGGEADGLEEEEESDGDIDDIDDIDEDQKMEEESEAWGSLHDIY